MDFYIIMCMGSMVVIPVLNLLIEFISGKKKENFFWLSVFCWFISVPWLTVSLTCTVFRFLRDLLVYTPKFRKVRNLELAKRYKEATDKISNFASKSDLEDLPENKPEDFKKAIVENLYSWGLIRFVGRFEEDFPKLVKAYEERLESALKNLDAEKAEERRKKEIDEKFNDMSA